MMGDKNEQVRERTEIIQNAGLYFPYNFLFCAKHSSGNAFAEARYLAEYCKEFRGKSIKEYLDVFEQNNNSFTRTLKMNPRSEPEPIKFSIKHIEYSNGIDDVNLTFEEYLRLGSPSVIQVDKHISSADSLEQKAEGGSE